MSIPRLSLLLFILPVALPAHDAHGRSNAPAEARRLKNPIPPSPTLAAVHYKLHCANCHGEDGRARTKTAGALPTRPTDLSHYLMESMNLNPAV